jgi:serine/threonine protein kinase
MKNVMLAEPSTIVLFGGFVFFLVFLLALIGAAVFLIIMYFSRKLKKPATPSAPPVAPSTQAISRKLAAGGGALILICLAVLLAVARAKGDEGGGVLILIYLAVLVIVSFIVIQIKRAAEPGIFGFIFDKMREQKNPAPPAAPSTQILPRKCPQCGAELKTDVSEGLCPACLLQRGIATEGDAPPGTPPFVPPTIPDLARLFPQLEILELIGKGGMGAVYKARQPSLDRFVALKILAPRSGGDLGFAERFTREARALAKLSHPNIVAVYDFGRAELPLGQDAQQRVPTTPVHYFIMEYVDGPNLRQVEQTGKLSAREALEIIPQICAALQFAHDEGIVHRDIKPENVLLDKKGRVKIADFGLAKILGQEKDFRLTGARDVVGTPHYMAPEQVEKPQTVDHRADIYSLGVVFYEMLTGELPLGKFQPPSSCARGMQIDVRLDEVVLHALEKEPARRYQQVSEVKTRVETIAATPGSSPVEEAQTEGAEAGGWNYTPGGWSPFTSPEVRQISAHMTKVEKLEAKKFGGWFGIWNAATFFLPMACVWFFPMPVPLNWIIASVVLLVGLAFYPLWWRKMANLLCDTAWAKERGYNPATLRIFPFGSTGIMLLGVVLSLIQAALWWQIYEPAGVWLPYLSQSSIPEPDGELLFHVTEVSQCKQIVLVRIACEPSLARYRLLATDSGPGFELRDDITNGMPYVDCLIAPDPNHSVGKALAGSNGFSGKADYLIGFVLPDAQAAAGAVKQVHRFYIAKSNGLTKPHDSLPLFSLRRRLGNDAHGKPVFEQIWCSFMLEAKSTNQRTLAGNPSFGPVIERVINLVGARTNFLIAFKTGNLRTPPLEIADSSSDIYNWAQRVGVDAGAGIINKDVLSGFDMAVIAAPAQCWEELSPAQAARRLDSQPLDHFNIMSYGTASLPDTCVFKTHEGGIGILQVTEYVSDPPGLKVRYKFLDKAPETPSMPVTAEPWSPMLWPGEKPDLQKVLDEARKLTTTNHYEEALQRYLWYYNHAREFSSGTSINFELSDWIELGRRYPKAKQALIEIREHDVHEFSAGRGYSELFSEIQSLNRELQDDGATLALFKTIQQQDKQLAGQCYYYVEDLLMQKGEYELCLNCIGDPQAHFESCRRRLEMERESQQRMEKMRKQHPMPEPRLPSGAFTPPDMGQMETNNFVGEVCKLVEILVATDHKAVAEKIRDQAVAILDNARLKSAVSDAEQKTRK